VARRCLGPEGAAAAEGRWHRVVCAPAEWCPLPSWAAVVTPPRLMAVGGHQVRRSRHALFVRCRAVEGRWCGGRRRPGHKGDGVRFFGSDDVDDQCGRRVEGG